MMLLCTLYRRARGIKSTDSQTTTLTTKGVFNEDHMIHRFMLMKQS